jgi:hypothetical protein
MSLKAGSKPMPTGPTQERKTIHDIASLIRQPVTDDATTNRTPPVEDVLDDDQTSPNKGEVDGDEEDQNEGEPLDETSPNEGEVDEDGDEDEGDEEGDDDEGLADFLDINDDDLIEVKIDGEVVLRSIADAKKALSGEGAIDKRLKEATELRKAAQAERTQFLEQFSVAQRNLVSTVQNLENVIFQPAVAPPPKELRQSNPQQYLLQQDAYEQDQDRINKGKAKLKELIQKQNEAFESDVATYREEQSQQLIEKLPALRSAQEAPKLLERMSKVAQEVYGFSPAELQAASDHRYYLMMADLAKFHEARGRLDRKTNTVTNLDGQSNKRPRKLRSGATQLKTQVRKQAEAQKKVTEVARKTGKVKDVAATLIKRG